MLVQMIKVHGMITSNLQLCQESVASNKLYLIHSAYCVRNGTLQVELIRVTILTYQITHDKVMAYFFKIDFSEGIGSPAKAALTLIRLKEKKRQKLGAPVLINQLITFQ